MNNQIPNVMTFSTTDPSGGAGLQADILTLSSLGCYPLSITCGISVQDTVGVESMMAIGADCVNDQARLILEDIEVTAFKCGVLGSLENIATVAEIVGDYPDIPLIVDPILSSGRGDELVDENMMKVMKELLFPQSLIITPNSYEARRFVIREDEEFIDISLDECADRLKLYGCQNILISGTHEQSDSVINTFYSSSDQKIPYYWERLPDSYHGSGCTLASAIAGCIARGLDIEEAIKEAQNFTWQTLKNAFKPGMGQYIPDRFFWINSDDDGKYTHH